MLDGGAEVRRRLGGAARARPGRARLGEPDRPDHRRGGAERRVRRRGRAPARVRRATRSSASTTTTTPGRRWTSSARPWRRSGAARSRPTDGYQGDYMADLAREPGDPVPRMLEQIEADLERFRIHFDTFERQSVVEAEIPAALEAIETFEADGAVWAKTSRARGRPRPRRHPLGRDADLLRGRRRVHPPQVRARLRPARLRARRRPSRVRRAPRRARGDARPPARGGRGADLPARPPDARRRGRGDVEAARRRRVPRRLHRRDRRRRGALVPPLARSRPDDRDRRRPRRGAEPEEPRLLRAVRARARRRDPAERRGPRARPAAGRRRSRPRSASS